MGTPPEAAQAASSFPRIITYSLRAGRVKSDEYYAVITQFADEWTAKALHSAGDVIAGFRQFRREHNQVERSDVEHAFEFLVLGVLLYEHGAEAVRWPRWLTRTLAALCEAQARWPILEGAAKAMRGIANRWVRRPTRALLNADVVRLIAWLRANGESVKAERLTEWQDYFDEIGSYPTRRILARCLSLAASFAADSSLALGKYTGNVNQFLVRTASTHRGQYDAELVGRTRLEYHLGMLGSEILNRAYRAHFNSAQHKIVIVPPCMRAQPEGKCKAIQTSFGLKCQACTPACRVHQITRLGEKSDFDVFIIPDELRVLRAGASGGQAGVVGVSCALTNWGGGWEADKLGIPAQGLLLDYVGCTYHWDKDGITTDTNLRQLRKILGLRRLVESG